MMRGTGSTSQKKAKRDDKEHHTLNSCSWEPRIRFNRHFPHDIILEILYRANIEALDACTRVSKGWRDLITDRSFIEFYQKKHNIGGLYSTEEWLDFMSYHGFMDGKRNKKEFAGYFWQYATNEYPHIRSIFVPSDEKNCDPSVRKWRIPKEMEILAACKQEGLVFCRDRNNYIVGMPAVDKWMIMPACDDEDDYQKWLDGSGDIHVPEPEDLVYGMVVLGTSPLWYKFVKLVWKDCEIYYQIYDSKVRGWLKARVGKFDYQMKVSNYHCTVSVPGSIYWETTNGYVLEFKGFEDLFHFYTLTVGLYYERRWIHEFNGRLGCSKMTKGKIELWEIDDMDVFVWHKRRELHVEDVNARRHENHEIWYIRDQDEIIIHGEPCCKCQNFPFGL